MTAPWEREKAVSRELRQLVLDIFIAIRARFIVLSACIAAETALILKNADEIAAQLGKIKLEIRLVDGTQHVFLNDEDVSEEIRLPEISMAASAVSAVPAVRAALLDLQRNVAANNSAIMDGRDIGTVVLPNAEVKIFLTASPEIRAKRRYDELVAKGKDVKFDDVLRELNERDYADMHRETAPLKQADDAVLADTSELDFEQSVDLVCRIINDKIK